MCQFVTLRKFPALSHLKYFLRNLPDPERIPASAWTGDGYMRRLLRMELSWNFAEWATILCKYVEIQLWIQMSAYPLKTRGQFPNLTIPDS